MNKLQWLHLSDIHYNFDNYDTQRMREISLEYIRKLAVPFDFIVITGDIRYRDKSYTGETIEFIRQVMKACGVQKDNLFIVPGNHDVKRNSRRNRLIKGTLVADDPCEEVNRLDKDEPETYNELISGQDDFFAFYKQLLDREYPKGQLHFVEKRSGYSIVHVNTCLVSGMDGEDTQSRLIIGQKKLHTALKGIDKNAFNIAIGHHSVECLNSEEQRRFMNNLSDARVDAYLSGHVHQPKAIFDTNNINNIYLFGCGSGMSDKYSHVGMITGIMEMESGQGSVTFHKWEPVEEYWHRAVDLGRKAPDGVVEFKINKTIPDIGNRMANNIPEPKPDTPKPGENPFSMYLEAITDKYSTLPMIGFKRSFDMDNIYIPLTVHVDPESKFGCGQDKAGEKFFGRQLKAEDLMDLPDRVTVVLGEPGMGKTTMLRYLALRESKKTNGLFPVFVKLSDFSKTDMPLESFLLAAVANQITGSAMKNAALNAIQGQRAFILLDGLDELSREKYNAVTGRIRDFIYSHKNCRIIITSRNAGFKSHEVPYRIFEIDKLPLTEIKAFVNNWFEGETGLAETD